VATMDLLTNPALVAGAKADWQDKMQGRQYRPLLPADRKPTPR